jgi:hypothetical protein
MEEQERGLRDYPICNPQLKQHVLFLNRVEMQFKLP